MCSSENIPGNLNIQKINKLLQNLRIEKGEEVNFCKYLKFDE